MSFPFLIMNVKTNEKYMTREDFREMREYQQFLEKRLKLLAKEHNQMIQIIATMTDSLFGKKWRSFGNKMGDEKW